MDLASPVTERPTELDPLPYSPERAEQLLQRYGSPLYVYDADRLRQTIHHITTAIPYPETRFQFASVTNGTIALLHIFQQAGWGIHANTPGDVYLALEAGFQPHQIVYSGSNLHREEMAYLLQAGIRTFNLDSVSQLQQCCELYRQIGSESIELGLRLHQPELLGASRIGVNPEDFPEAIAVARHYGLKVQGLHFYRGTGTQATLAFTQAIEALLTIAQGLPDWNTLDFGGGFGYPYQHGKVAFDWPLFGRVLTDHLELWHQKNQQDPGNQKGRQRIRLILEPGRAVIAGCATLLTRVVSIKWQGSKQIVGVDTTVANLSVPSVHGGYREIRALNPQEGSWVETDVCGNTTYSRDYLGQNRQLPLLNIGDCLAILDVGAYGYAMSSHFLHRPRPAEVLLEGSSDRLIRERESYRVLLNHQVY